jgi:phage tail sheath protein FI
MHAHISGKSINAIRTFTGKGTLVWGARTVDRIRKKER